MNANDATLTALTTAQTGSTVADHAPNAPANPGFDLILGAAAGSALGSCGARYTLTISAIELTTATQAWPARACQQAFDPDHGWAISGTGPDYQCRQTFPVTVPGGVGGPLAGHVLQCVASPGQPRRADRLHHPKPPIRARLTRASPRHHGSGHAGPSPQPSAPFTQPNRPITPGPDGPILLPAPSRAMARV